MHSPCCRKLNTSLPVDHTVLQVPLLIHTVRSPFHSCNGGDTELKSMPQRHFTPMGDSSSSTTHGECCGFQLREAKELEGWGLGLVCLVLALQPQQQRPSEPMWPRAVSKGKGRVHRQQILAIMILQWENCLEHGRKGMAVYCAWQPHTRAQMPSLNKVAGQQGLPATPAEPSLSSTQEILDSSATKSAVITQKEKSNGLKQGTTAIRGQMTVLHC